MEDKRTIGLTEANRKTMMALLESGFFNDRMDVAKLAMSIAINNNVQPTGSESTETIWNVGSFDPDGDIKGLIQALYPDIETPYRAVEYLYNEGFRIIAEMMEKDDFNILDLTRV